jgi:hypothetical protein
VGFPGDLCEFKYDIWVSTDRPEYLKITLFFRYFNVPIDTVPGTALRADENDPVCVVPESNEGYMKSPVMTACRTDPEFFPHADGADFF